MNKVPFQLTMVTRNLNAGTNVKFQTTNTVNEGSDISEIVLRIISVSRIV